MNKNKLFFSYDEKHPVVWYIENLPDQFQVYRVYKVSKIMRFPMLRYTIYSVYSIYLKLGKYLSLLLRYLFAFYITVISPFFIP